MSNIYSSNINGIFLEDVLPKMFEMENIFLKNVVLSQFEQNKIEYLSGQDKINYDNAWKYKTNAQKAFSYNAFFIKNPSLSVKKKFLDNAFHIEKFIGKYEPRDQELMKIMVLRIAHDFCTNFYMSLSTSHTKVETSSNYAKNCNNGKILCAEVSKKYINNPLVVEDQQFLTDLLFAMITSHNTLSLGEKAHEANLAVKYTKAMLQVGFDEDKLKENMLKNPNEMFNLIRSISNQKISVMIETFRTFGLWSERNEKFDLVEKHVHENSYSSLRKNILSILKSKDAIEYSSGFSREYSHILKNTFIQGDLKGETLQSYTSLKSVLGLGSAIDIAELFTLLKEGVDDNLEDTILNMVKDEDEDKVNLGKHFKNLSDKHTLNFFEKTYNSENPVFQKINNLSLQCLEKSVFDKMNILDASNLSFQNLLLERVYCKEFMNIYLAKAFHDSQDTFDTAFKEFYKFDKENAESFLNRLIELQDLSQNKQGVKFKVNLNGKEVSTVGSKNKGLPFQYLISLKLSLAMNKVSSNDNVSSSGFKL